MTGDWTLRGGPADGQTATPRHPLDLNVYVPIADGWARYRRSDTRQRVAHFQDARTFARKAAA